MKFGETFFQLEMSFDEASLSFIKHVNSNQNDWDVGDGNYSHKSSSGDKGSTHDGIIPHGNSHQNVNQINLHANEMHKSKLFLSNSRLVGRIVDAFAYHAALGRPNGNYI